MTLEFVLSRHDHHVVGLGVRHTFPDIADAVAAVRDGRNVVGAIPFDMSDATALIEPEQFYRLDGPWSTVDAQPPLPEVTVARQIPDPDVHVQRVRDVVEQLKAGVAEKIVLARAIEVTADSPIDAASVLSALVSRDPMGNGFLADLSPATHRGRHIVGASPTLLVRKRGNIVTCHPFAGTAARSTDPDEEARISAALAASAKDQAEHRFVVDEIRAALTPFCETLEVPESPQLSSTPQLWHLSTPIVGTLADPETSALDLALALHPTAAVAGVPRAAAMAAIADVEGSRGFYAGAVGWTDGSGDGEWMVTIRCIELSADGLSGTATAGGGIVADSDPDAELDETTAKFRTVLSVFEH
ncbi:isochorismate synthase [Rhodococcus sp. 05-2255-3C]|uniref:isochorismate synthase n=1 Tax=Rhodococcus sp. 05-2255-3C TaxID=2022483 RepID=UPI000B9B3CB4|nr:isochorismate synthase [Rhodococcus sp. 05-2255-3C]OZE11672.1 isochorismate synthase [Rhodococcus sp. 05-2255-3C]